ncbi:hypothetical protein [Bartonella gabonensis]|uniref:hypothetical protein n=1 Tax=Bartonella gabonensis TaxID=2699889 RepID=UPI00158C764B|nr:hypothetical protein [Bartonella gabonensis]
MFKLVLYFFFLFPFISYAQETKQKTDNPSLILTLVENYSLTEDLLLKMEKIEKECKISLLEIKNDPITYHHSIDSNIENYTAYISRKPKVVSILKRNNLTPNDFAAGVLTLRGISMLSAFLPEKEYSSEKNIIFLNNLQFVKKHFYKITTLLGSCEELILRN